MQQILTCRQPWDLQETKRTRKLQQQLVSLVPYQVVGLPLVSD